MTKLFFGVLVSIIFMNPLASISAMADSITVSITSLKPLPPVVGAFLLRGKKKIPGLKTRVKKAAIVRKGGKKWYVKQVIVSGNFKKYNQGCILYKKGNATCSASKWNRRGNVSFRK